MQVINTPDPHGTGIRKATALLGLAAAMALSACNTMVVTTPMAQPAKVAYRLPPLANCVPADARDRARILTQFQAQFRGPLHRNGRRMSYAEYIRTRHARVYDCGTVWRIVFTPIWVNSALPSHDYLLRKDGVMVYFPFG